MKHLTEILITVKNPLLSVKRKLLLLGYDVPLLSEKLDWISVMAYDYHGQWDEVTGHVAPMYEHPDDIDKTFNAVRQFVDCFFFFNILHSLRFSNLFLFMYSRLKYYIFPTKIIIIYGL